MRPPEGCLSSKAAAIKSGYCVKYVYRLGSKGKIECIKQDGRSYFSLESLRSYQDSLRRPRGSTDPTRDVRGYTIRARKKTMISILFDEEALKHDSTEEIASAIQGRLDKQGNSLSLDEIVSVVEGFGK